MGICMDSDLDMKTGLGAGPDWDRGARTGFVHGGGAGSVRRARTGIVSGLGSGLGSGAVAPPVCFFFFFFFL